jgi:hypothetical protein
MHTQLQNEEDKAPGTLNKRIRKRVPYGKVFLPTDVTCHMDRSTRDKFARHGNSDEAQGPAQ